MQALVACVEWLTLGVMCPDVVALLCLRNAREGGLSSWASSISVYNEVLRRRPDLAHLLAGPWFFDRKGEVPPGKKGFFEIPVFNFHEVSIVLPANSGRCLIAWAYC